MILTPFPILETERLHLRKLTMDDTKEVLFLRSDAHVNQFVIRPAPKNIEDAEAFVNRITLAVANDETYYWVITLKDDPKMIGSVSLWNYSEDRKKGEVGYDLRPDHENKGIMSEAIAAVLKYGFVHLPDRKDDNNPKNIVLELTAP